MGNPERIDTHLHVVPPAYANWLQQMGQAAGGLPIPHWTLAAALELMDTNEIKTGLLSVSTPGVFLGDVQQARRMARVCNEYAGGVVRGAADRFGFFATLTLPDVEGSLAEIDNAFDQLNADGVVVLCNVDGVYLGEEDWTPVFQALEQRQAVVFIHPSFLPGPEVPGIPPYVADFLLDTTRAAISIARAGWLEQFPNIKFILSHAGGFIPYAAERIGKVCAPDGPASLGIKRLQRFYYDTALSGSPYALPSLLAFADPARIIFGSDWPYASTKVASHFTNLFDDFGLDGTQRYAINRGNALGLFPRLA